MAEEKTGARRMVPWIVGVALVLAGVVWWQSGDKTRATANDTREQAESTSAERAQQKPIARSPRSGDAPQDDDDDAVATPTEADAKPPAPTSTEGTEEDPLRPVKAAMADPSDKGTQALLARLTSTDEVVVAEAANALIARRAVDTIPSIAKLDLAAAAGSGLSIIDALGRLGAVADASGRTAAVDRLLAMLAEEKKRDARESAANLLQIYEALGRLGDPRGRVALEAELLDPTVPRAPKVVIVKSLVQLGQAESRTALTAARTQQLSSKGEDDFQEEIRVELIGEIDRALQEL